MKKLILILMALLIGCATIPGVTNPGYTYDGEYDPVVFYEWDVVAKWNCEKGHLHILLANPDVDSDIPMVETMNIPGDGEKMRIVAYRYLKGTTMYFFSFNEKTYNYDQWGTVTDKSGGI